MGMTGAAGGALNWMMSTGFDVVLLLLALIAGIGLIAWIVMQTRRATYGVDEAAAVIQTAAEEGVSPREAFAARFDGISETLSAHRVVGRAWRRFSSTIVPLEAKDGVEAETTLVSRSVTPTQYFTPENLDLESPMAAIVPPAFLAVFSFLAGIGLAASIGGLAAAYGPTVTDGAAASTAIASTGGKLIVLAVTIGLFLALRTTTLWSRRLAADAVRRFNDVLVDRVYFENVESAGVRRQDAMHFQAKSLQRLGEKLANSIGGATRDAILDGYSDIVTRMETLTTRYDDLVANAQQGAREAVSEAFTDTVQTSADTIVQRMEAAAVQLGSLPEHIERTSKALESAGATIAGEQHRFATEMQTAATQAIATSTQTLVQDLERSIRGIMDESREVSAAVSDRLAQLPNRVEEAARTFDTALNQMITVQTVVAEETQARTQHAVTEVSGLITQAVGKMARSVDETISVSLLQTTQTLQSVSTEMAQLPDRLASIAGSLEQAGAGLTEANIQALAELKASTREMTVTTAATIAERVNENTSSFLSRLQDSNEVLEARTRSLTNLLETFGQTSDRIADTHARFTERMRQSAEEMTTATADAIATRVNETTASFVAKLHESNDALETRAQSMAAVLQSFEQTSQHLSQNHAHFMAEMQQGVRELTANTAEAIAAKVDENSIGFIAKLTESNDALEQRAQSMAGVLTAFEQTGERIAQTHTHFMAELQQSARDMTTATADAVAERINENTTTFMTKLEESNEALDGRTRALATLLASIEQTGDRMAETHIGVLADLKIGARDLAKATSEAITEKVNENAVSFMDQLNQANAAFQERTEALSRLLGTLEETGDRISESHTHFMTRVQQNTRDLTATTVQSIAQAVNEHTTTFLDKLGDANTGFEERAAALGGLFSTLQKASDRIAETHTQFIDQMEDRTRELTASTAESLAESFNEHTALFIEKLNESNAAFEERAGALGGLFATLQKASDRIAETHTRFIGEIQTGSRDVIVQTTQAVAEEIKQNAVDIISRLKETDEYFASRVEGLSSLLPQIDQTSRGLAEIMERISVENGRVGSEFVQLSEMLHGATSNIKNSADSFANNLLAIQQSLGAFQQISQETIATVGNSQRTLKDSVGMQAELWQRHVERFDDVDRKLGDVFAEMSSQIDTQTRLMRDQVAEMDAALATAVNHLGELVEELNESRAGVRKVEAYG
ncbi:hypothetical protein [Oricola sp.]|uniref:hypothetical protein n=1 Tax=Oricola sp. TaxID=1979950 RepID=UPI0025F4669C|nr:hypothetical protein [Oricola sp.]MCI5073447.1 hypothetical protein [Oricola sp.]